MFVEQWFWIVFCRSDAYAWVYVCACPRFRSCTQPVFKVEPSSLCFSFEPSRRQTAARKLRALEAAARLHRAFVGAMSAARRVASMPASMHVKPDPVLMRGDVWAWALGGLVVDVSLFPNKTFEEFEKEVQRTFEVVDWFAPSTNVRVYSARRAYVNVGDLAFAQLFCVAGFGWTCFVHLINVS